MRKQNTPYKFDPEWFDLTDSKGNRIATDLSIDVAEFIVKVCNNHDRLVEALGKASAMLSRVQDPATASNLLHREIEELLTELKS